MPNTITINAALAAAVSYAQSKERSRYYLCGIQIERHPEKGAYLVATNGHVLTCAWDKGASLDAMPSDSMLISLPAPFLNKAKAQNLLELTMPEPRKSEGIVRSSDKPLRDIYDVIDGTFPDWRRILPNCEGEERAATRFTAAPVNILTKTADLLCGGMFSLQHVGDNGPMLVRYETNNPNIFSVIMPARTKGDATSIPFSVSPCGPARKQAAE